MRQLLKVIPRYYSTPETRIPCADRDKFAWWRDLAAKFSREKELIEFLFVSGKDDL